MKQSITFFYSAALAAAFPALQETDGERPPATVAHANPRLEKYHHAMRSLTHDEQAYRNCPVKNPLKHGKIPPAAATGAVPVQLLRSHISYTWCGAHEVALPPHPASSDVHGAIHEAASETRSAMIFPWQFPLSRQKYSHSVYHFFAASTICQPAPESERCSRWVKNIHILSLFWKNEHFLPFSPYG